MALPATPFSLFAGQPLAFLLMGPTASGKSRLALELAARLPVEIVSVDSAQVYRGMDVGTAKPGADERRAVPHHLIDILDPTEAYSAARFRTDAIGLVGAIAARGRVPLLVGGTMLYFKALQGGLSALPSADTAVRAEIDAEAQSRGWPALHAELARVDPASAARLEPADSQRIQRALEVFRLTGSPMSQQLGARDSTPPFRLLPIALVPSDRGELHRRIAARFDAMLAGGLVEELEGLRRRYTLRAGLPSMRCVGYRQAWSYMAGAFGRDELRDRGIYATRQLAKRQLTWLRGWADLQAFDCLDPQVAPHVLAAVQRAIEG